MKFLFTRKMITAAFSVCVIYCTYFYWSNSGIEGIYRCDGIGAATPNNQTFAIILRGRIHAAIYDGTRVTVMPEIFSYYEKDGKYFIDYSLNDKAVNNEINADFSKLNWPYYDSMWIKMENRKKPEGDLSRILNPLLKSKIHTAIRDLYSEGKESILGLW